ncbi:alpha/beta fold hydrolase [Shewanella sp. SR44-3]|uniref:alpha/beta fold hydrolase n=1 Tax=unclassified Shewanella TaxID=196818 RepID=UPI0015F899C7|nr:alpha/beta fold hydrolase [Shewanella sp. SR44-3]MBB1269862.1 dienelactone hydrolase family protein [Shewanella sp. SR44-3]
MSEITSPEASALAIDYVVEGSISDRLVIFAHGAGANMHSNFMQQMSHDLVNAGCQVLRFNFLYMQANMQDGKRRPPDRAAKLLAHFESVLEWVEDKITQGELAPKHIYLMGKSMGGRMAATLMSDNVSSASTCTRARNLTIDGIICLGYPFIPVSGGEPRLDAINNCQVPVLVIQGERDKFGTQVQIPTWALSEGIRWHWLVDGDHSFVPRKASGVTLEHNMAQALQASLGFMDQLKHLSS